MYKGSSCLTRIGIGLSALEGCNMGTCGLPEMYSHSPRETVGYNIRMSGMSTQCLRAAGLKAKGEHFR